MHHRCRTPLLYVRESALFWGSAAETHYTADKGSGTLRVNTAAQTHFKLMLKYRCVFEEFTRALTAL
jgi:hypothetical protein